MDRERARDFDQELLDLYDDYAHGRLNRRDFGLPAARFAVPASPPSACSHGSAPTMHSPSRLRQTTRRIIVRDHQLRVAQGRWEDEGTPCTPESRRREVPGGPGVIHENRGLNPYVADVARRLAVQGFLPSPPTRADPAAGRLPGERRRGPRPAGECRPRPDD